MEAANPIAPCRRHPGLQLDKFSFAGKQEEQGRKIDEVVRCGGDESLLAELRSRRAAALDRLGACRLYQGRTEGPLTLHLARSGSLENAGIALHPIYGFAWLPGTGVKGMVRSWAETVWRPSQTDRATAADVLRGVFGTTESGGAVVFYDAWPVRWPRLERDIVNNHHGDYYEGKSDPVDNEAPSPVSFLAVAPNSEFDFPLALRPGASDGGQLDLVEEWMRSALAHFGAGAKTAAGYGRIVPVEGNAPAAPETRVHGEHHLELISPAFLAGAGQRPADCDLRGATLRGLLRWWWRTMHVGSLAREDLLKLETAVWGSADTGSPISIRVTPERAAQIGERFKTKKRGRPFRFPGDRWRLALSARDGGWNERRVIPRRDLLEQAEAALWLLVRFGGAGSRSRKGFGSFADVSVPSISSRADCVARGEQFRRSLGIRSVARTRRTRGSSLCRALEVCVPTPWTDSWYALDQVGTIYQEFAKGLDSPDDRAVLGLPRRVGGRSVRRPGADRFASPAHWSLSRGNDGTLTVRLIVFPEAVPFGNGRVRVLRELQDYAQQQLGLRTKEFRNKGQRSVAVPRPADTRHDRTSAPQVGETVRARLLEARTKRGGWLAESLDGSIRGPIHNSADVPAECAPGAEVDLIVRVSKRKNGAFDWPTEAARKRSSRTAGPKRRKRARQQRTRGPARGRRR